jgi:hypothetical protein
MKRHLFATVCVLALLLGLQQRPTSAAGQVRVQQSALLGAAAPQALIVPAGAAGHTVLVAAAGFAPLETVTFRFGTIDPFTGTIVDLVFSVSGVTDLTGRLGDHWGSVPVPPQALPASLPGGLYTLQAAGARSGRTATVAVGLPFVAVASGLYCSAQPYLPGRYGYALAGPAASFAPSTEVIGVVNFPAPAETTARVGHAGRFAVIFRVPVGTPLGSYALVVAGLAAGASQREQLRTCVVAVTAG